MSARHVRVTITGTATAVLDSHGKPTRAIRVRYVHESREASTLLLTDAPGVEVEDMPDPRTWSDGDVVQVTSGSDQVTYSRELGAWLRLPYGVSASDDELTALVDATPADTEARVLRYQAGGE